MSTPRDRNTIFVSVAIWLGATALAVFLALLLGESQVIDGYYIPGGNDSFYHARRILDAAVGERGFYQFDERLQAPAGAWVPWPWAYDYSVAKLAQLAIAIAPTLDPMAFIAHVPVAWIAINAALFLTCASAIGLSLEMRVIAMVAFALSPLTQLLHAVGMVDHHYIEHTFVLLNLLLGLRWFQNPANAWRAAALGIALGVAPAFHSGLFILQILSLACVFVLWLRRAAPPLAALAAFAAALLIATELVLLPSETYRAGLFEFGLLSWFHFYVAFCTSVAACYMGWRPLTARSFAGLVAIAVAATVPMLGQLIGGAAFVSGEVAVLGDILEARSVYRQVTGSPGPVETATYYSWLVLLAPALLIFYAYRLVTEREPAQLFYATAAVFGLALLLAQFRFFYFGLFVLLTGTLSIVDRLREHFEWHRGAVIAAALAVIALAYQPALRGRLFVLYPPGADAEYASALKLYFDLAEQCAADPGIVLANSDDGSPILFHTDCSVLANNFVLRRGDEQKFASIADLMGSSPAEIRSSALGIRYVLVRAKDFSVVRDGVPMPVAGSPMAKQLFIDERPPEGFELIGTVMRRLDASSPPHVHARLFKITRNSG